MGLILSGMREEFKNCYIKDSMVTDLFGHLKAVQQAVAAGAGLATGCCG